MAIKIAILEKDGEEFFGPTEYDLYQALVETPEVMALLEGNNYHIIPEGNVMRISENKQEINYGGLEIYGQLEIFGSLVFI